jgi:hypothetical protein
MDADGDFVVVWQSFIQDGSSDGVYAQAYNAAGEAQGGEFPTNTYTTDSQGNSSIAMDADGNFVVVWVSYGQDASSTDGVYAQRYDSLPPSNPGDFDDDGDADADDIDILWRIVRSSGVDPGGDDSADLNGDGFTNEDDVDYMLANLVEMNPNDPGAANRYGDAELDEDVDGEDFNLWRTRPGYTGPGTGKWASGDFDGNGDVDGADFDLWRLRPTEYPGTVGPHTEVVSSQWSVVSGEGAVVGGASEWGMGSGEWGMTEKDAEPVPRGTEAPSRSTSSPQETSSPRRIPDRRDAATWGSPLYRSRHFGWASGSHDALEALLAGW